MELEHTDLRTICHGFGKSHCDVRLRRRDGKDLRWLTLAEVSLQRHDDGRATLKAYLKDGATDFEHDPAYACKLPLIGVRLKFIHSHTALLEAWIDPERDEFSLADFRVPRPRYDPLVRPDTEKCNHEDCGEHPIVAEGHYLPPFDEELFNAVRGKRVEIYIGPASAFSED